MRALAFFVSAASAAPAQHAAPATTAAPAAAAAAAAAPLPPALIPVEVGAGEYCHGEQIKHDVCTDHSGCPAQCTPKNCELSAWHDWSACDCEALKERHRGIKSHNNECGSPCEASLTETHKCFTNCTQPPVNCTLGAWSAWVGCGHGSPNQFQKTRSRQITAPTNGGEGCNASTQEILPCPNAPNPVGRDCEWNLWSAWSACTCSCDGGQKTRDRSVKIAPRGGGQPCVANAKTEIAPCNTHSCAVNACVDGTWAAWGAWDMCTAHCDGGVQWRHRVVAHPANSCGSAPAGKKSEVKPCNQGGCGTTVDCTFATWGPWSSCSCTCDGIEHRSRVISKYGTKGGAYCHGGTKEVRSCNNATANRLCSPEQPIDCQMSNWQAGQCTEHCGGGQVTSERTITRANQYGGLPCNGTLKKSEPCNTAPCAGPTPIDCSFNVWSDWSACDKCGGQRKQFRTIKTMPHHHGLPCRFEDTERVEGCKRHCHDPWYCVWSDWSSTSGCSTQCGQGIKSKQRELKPTRTRPAGLGLFEQVGPVGMQSRLQDLTISFACGSMITFLVLLVTMRVFRRENRDYSTVRRDAETHQLIDMRAAE